MRHPESQGFNDRNIWWFQKGSANKIIELWNKGVRRNVLVSPPGSGKTVMAEMIVKHVGKAFDRVVCLTHTIGLVDNFKTRTGIDTYTVQECLSKGGIPGKKPDCVIWDECHHSGAEGWGSVLDMAPKSAYLLGLTGTPQRSDGKALDRFDDMVVAAHYSELLMAGTIVPYRCLHPKEFHADSEPDPALAYKNYGEGKKAIFYCRSIEQANDVQRALGAKKAAVWHSGIPWKGKEGRGVQLQRFKDGELQCLVTVDALSEGVDIPDSEVVVLAVPCHNVSTYLQKTGRGGRSAPGKTHATLLDLSGAHLRHGPPTEDREYSINGTGIERMLQQGGGKGNGWGYSDRGERQQVERGSYDAELVVGYDWRAPSPEDKRKTLGWLVQAAGRRGWGREHAEMAFATLFGETAPGGAP
jgi:superfamily II DNA or RNA helicase